MRGARCPRYPRELLLNHPASSFADCRTVCNNLDDAACTNLSDAINQLSNNISSIICLTPVSTALRNISTFGETTSRFNRGRLRTSDHPSLAIVAPVTWRDSWKEAKPSQHSCFSRSKMVVHNLSIEGGLGYDSPELAVATTTALKWGSLAKWKENPLA
jgi:hypothetical protein